MIYFVTSSGKKIMKYFDITHFSSEEINKIEKDYSFLEQK